MFLALPRFALASHLMSSTLLVSIARSPPLLEKLHVSIFLEEPSLWATQREDLPYSNPTPFPIIITKRWLSPDFCMFRVIMSTSSVFPLPAFRFTRVLKTPGIFSVTRYISILHGCGLHWMKFCLFSHIHAYITTAGYLSTCHCKGRSHQR